MENEDIAVELLEKVRQQYDDGIEKNEILQGITELIEKKTATYEDVNKAAQETGKILSGAYQEITSDNLPDGRMYYNIADRVVGNTMKEAYEYIADLAEETQSVLNENAGIGIKAVRPELNQDRISGILNRLANAGQFEDIAWILQEPIRVFCQSIVDDFVKSNVEFQGEAGLHPKIIRKSSGKCCEWCSKLAGEYVYPDLPRTVYQRHEYCRCTVQYDPGDGKRLQDVHTKQWTETEKDVKLEARKVIGLKVNGVRIKSVSDHVTDRMRERSVKFDSVKDAVERPLEVKAIKTDQNGNRSFTVIGRKATVVINPDTGRVVTTYPTHTKTMKKLLKKRGLKR